MSKKEKIIWGAVGIIAIILLVLISVKLISILKNKNNSETPAETSEEIVDLNKDKVLEATENTVFPSDLVGTWLTAVVPAGSEEVEYQGFVLRPDGTALSINSSVDYATWRVEDYKLIFTLDSESEINEISFVVDYIGKDGLTLRIGDTTVEYTLEAK